MRVTLIVAMSENRVIGHEGGIPWHVSADLRRFKRLTTGHTIVMGRKTWDSLPRKPLPDREHVVVTRSPTFEAPGAVVVHALEDALAHAKARGEEEAFVIGGGEIYRLALPHADRLEITILHTRVEGDTHFPEYDAAAWVEVARERHDEEPVPFTFVTLDRRRA